MTEMDICQRCRTNETTVISRKEKFCTSCFTKFIVLKQRKQMMSSDYYRDIFKILYKDKIRSAEEAHIQNLNSRILVPLSLGSSSLVLLDILNKTLDEQLVQHRGITGFRVDVLVCYSKTRDDIEEINSKIAKLKSERYASNKDRITFHVVSLDSFFENCNNELRKIILHNQTFSSMAIDIKNDQDHSYGIDELLKACPNRSTQIDLLTFITRHVVKKFAYQHEFKAILWGHSMTKLADEIISLVVKGRGEQIATSLDTKSFDFIYGGDKFKNLYPLKDVLLAEVDAYCELHGLSQYLVNYETKDTLLVKKKDITGKMKNKNIKLVRNMTINELARKYFDDIEGDYSNVIATVLRTGDKLAEPETQADATTTAASADDKCSLCLGKLHSNASNWLRSIAVIEGFPIANAEEQELYDRWSQSEIGIEMAEYMKLKDDIWTHGEDILLCYGCIITMNGIKMKNVTWPKFNDKELNDTLNEYVLSDAEGEEGEPVSAEL
ncbi:Ncs2p NDAI_0F02800 [Naumovozyma dairenensis CBS 421]|uniref:Cytoplasmic tRNA 2-thiolation protein 2 n=1 Tax=Naumovozyma dairenensis (strain ATCC 10597 / BCRC 20456 / CBS 421 / NBRC 0211 / NRRL Y-12639) TaxID=1071378 RepID=G0WCT7_NAUDC|nr:hypothetical protein NDAI_0F02800 [Naumovozyma dairenensis CBS 421]CCD25598.1 hypothetical protein NDAI_0F02800 [Naumovozyma dairenensis CBS 421]